MPQRNWWEDDPIVDNAPRPVISNPRMPEQMRGDALGNQRTAQQIRGDNLDYQIKGATATPTIRKANAEADKAEADAKEAMGIEKPLSLEQLHQLRDEAQKNLGVLDDLDKGTRKWFGTGALAPTMSHFGGTNATNQLANARQVGAGGALSKIMEMAKANGGKNPLTPMSNSDAEMIGNSIANLSDIGQSDEAYRKNVQRYRDFYWKIFNTADDKIIAQGGKTKNPFRLKAGIKDAPRKSGNVDAILSKYGVK